MANKTRNKGKVLAQYLHLKVKQVSEYVGEGKSRRMKNSKIFIFNGKKKVGNSTDGYKTKEIAVEEIKKLI